MKVLGESMAWLLEKLRAPYAIRSTCPAEFSLRMSLRPSGCGPKSMWPGKSKAPPAKC